jgi:hypothetical protein
LLSWPGMDSNGRTPVNLLALNAIYRRLHQTSISSFASCEPNAMIAF